MPALKLNANNVAWNPPELLSSQQNAYVPQGEYRALTSTAIVGADSDYPGREVNTWGDLVVHVTVWDGPDRETRQLVSEFFESYTGTPANYMPHREEVK